MSFAHPALLAVLPLVVLLAAAWAFASGRARRRTAMLTRRPLSRPPYAAALLFSLSACAAVVAAAGPRWGTETLELPREGAEIIFVVDVSRSMAAADTQPSRLALARDAIAAAIARLDGDRVGIVIFGGSGYLRLPPTTDAGAAHDVVASLDAGTIFVEPGSSIAQGLATAARLPFPDEPGIGRVFVLVSDADDFGVDPTSLATRIGDIGIDVIVAGVGTPQGGTIPVFEPGSGGATDKLDASGEPIVTRLNEPLLLEVARAAGGRYLGADLSLLPGALQGRLAALRDARIDERAAPVPVERFQLFAGAALALVLAAVVIEKLPAIVGAASRSALPRSAGTLANVLGLLAVIASSCGEESPGTNEHALDAFAAGDFASAARLFEEARQKDPRDFQLSLNLALALFAAGDNDAALQAASEAARSVRPELRGAANAAAAHIHFADGDLPAALESFEQALRADPQSAYRHDYEVVLRLLQPTPGPTQTPPASETPLPAGTPGQGDPATTPGPGQTPIPGDPGSPGPTPPGATPGSGDGNLPGTIREVDDRIARLDEQISLLLPDSGQPIDPEKAREILDLLAERARLASLREALGGGSDPRDY